MNLKETLIQLFARAGVDKNEAITALLEKKEIADQEIPNEIHNVILTNLMTAEQAKTNPQVKKHYMGELLSPINNEIDNNLTAFELEELRNELAGEVSTYKKLPKLIEGIKAKLEKRSMSSDDKKALQESIDKLNAQIVDERKAAKKQMDDRIMAYKQKLLDHAMKSSINGAKFTTNLDDKTNAIAAMTLINEELATKGIRAVYNEETNAIDLFHATNPELPYTEMNEKVAFNKVVERAIAPLLKVSSPPPGGGPRKPAANGGDPPKDTRPAQTDDVVTRIKQDAGMQ